MVPGGIVVTDAEYEQQKARVQALADKWIGPLGLKWWKIRIDYSRERLPVKDDGNTTEDTFCAMQVQASWKYLRAVITVSVPAIADIGDEELEWVFVHECAHVLLNEMRWADQADWLDHEERCASQLANSFLWLRQHVERECRNADQSRAGG